MPLHVSTRADDIDKHSNDVNALVYAKGKLYSGADDGKIKMWEEDLTFLAQVQAHATSVYSITASQDTLYSCSNDGTVKAWELDTLKPKGTIDTIQDEFWKVKYHNGLLYVGDDQGDLRVYKDAKLFAEESTCNPIKDMVVSENFVFSVKDSDLVITEFKTGDKWMPSTNNTLVGRAPLTIAGDKLAFVSRTGKDILVHENSSDVQFKKVTELTNAHDLIINALAGVRSGNKALLYSGGWDRLVKQWIIEDGALKPIDQVGVDIVVNVIAPGEKGEIYAAGADGHVVRIDVQ